METDEVRQQKAKQLRYKHPISTRINAQVILDDLDEWGRACEQVEYSLQQIDLDDVFGGDEESAAEFKMAFGMLNSDIQEMNEDLNWHDAFEYEYFADWFDEIFPAVKAAEFGGYLGYDSWENDYYPLEQWEESFAESEARKRLKNRTKDQILDRVGRALGIFANYMGLKYRYDCLEASMNVIKGVNVANLQLIRNIEDAYEKAHEASSGTFDSHCKEVQKFNDLLLWNVPDEAWM